jgi:hypothetical protein
MRRWCGQRVGAWGFVAAAPARRWGRARILAHGARTRARTRTRTRSGIDESGIGIGIGESGIGIGIGESGIGIGTGESGIGIGESGSTGSLGRTSKMLEVTTRTGLAIALPSR